MGLRGDEALDFADDWLASAAGRHEVLLLEAQTQIAEAVAALATSRLGRLVQRLASRIGGGR